MTGVVLAGGMSSRMGRQKAFLEIEGRTLVERALDALSQVCPRLLVVAARAGEFAGYGVEVAVDEYPGSGPLAGIHAALAASGDDCLVAACDQPFLEPALLRALLERALCDAVAQRDDVARATQCAPHYGAAVGRARAAAPFALGRLQPMPAVYPSWAIDLARARLEARRDGLSAAGELRLGPFLDALDPSELSEAECRAIDPGLRSFVNLNRPADLDAARRIVAARQIVAARTVVAARVSIVEQVVSPNA